MEEGRTHPQGHPLRQLPVTEEVTDFTLADHQYIRIQQTGPRAIAPGAVERLQANCIAGERAIGGGVSVDPDDRPTSSLRIQESYPGRSYWKVLVRNRAGVERPPADLTVYAVCLGSAATDASLTQFPNLAYAASQSAVIIAPGAVPEIRTNCTGRAIPVAGGIQLEEGSAPASLRLQESFPAYTPALNWTVHVRNLAGPSRPDASTRAHAVCLTDAAGPALTNFENVYFVQEDVSVVAGDGVTRHQVNCAQFGAQVLAGGVELVAGSEGSLRIRESFPDGASRSSWTFDIMNRAGIGRSPAQVRLTAICLN